MAAPALLLGSPTLVRSVRSVGATTFIDVDVTGARTMFITRNQPSTALTTDNAGVTVIAYDAVGPRRNMVLDIAQGTSGVVRITGNATASLWGCVLINWPTQQAVATSLTSNSTADMGTAPLAVSPDAQVVVFWNTNGAADWDVTTPGYTNLETITTQLAEPSWALRFSNAAVGAGYTTPTMSRGKEGTARFELCSVAAVTDPGGGGGASGSFGTTLWPRDLQYQLNRLAKTLVNDRPTLAADAAANKWAGTTKELPLQGALNFKAGILWPKDYFAIRRVCNQIAGTVNEDEARALSTIATPALRMGSDTPTSEWLRQDIINWLQDHGVGLTNSALQHMTKAELLALVDDLTDEENP